MIAERAEFSRIERSLAYIPRPFSVPRSRHRAHDGRATADDRAVELAWQGAPVHAWTVTQAGPLRRERKLAHIEQPLSCR